MLFENLFASVLYKHVPMKSKYIYQEAMKITYEQKPQKAIMKRTRLNHSTDYYAYQSKENSPPMNKKKIVKVSGKFPNL